MEVIQLLKPFEEKEILNVPNGETGEIYIHIFADESGNELLEKSSIKS